MGRYAGIGPALKKRKQQLASRFGVPMSKVPRGQAAQASGLRIERIHYERPGAVVRVVGDKAETRAMNRTRPRSHSWMTVLEPKPTDKGVDAAVKKMRKFNPKTGEYTNRRKPRK